MKVVLVGDSGVGKSTLMLRFSKGEFINTIESTIGAAFVRHNVSLPSGDVVELEIWDTAGQERYAALMPMYFRDLDAAVLVYDLSCLQDPSQRHTALNNLCRWQKTIIDNLNPLKNSPVFLVGARRDLYKGTDSELEGDIRIFLQEFVSRHDNPSEGLKFAKTYITSSFTGLNVKEVFSEVALSSTPASREKDGVRLDREADDEHDHMQREKRCCR